MLLKNLIKQSQPDNPKKTLGIFVLLSLVMQAGLVLWGLLHLIMTFKVAFRPTPTLVQLETGEAITVASLGNAERTPEVIQRFTLDILTTMFTWTGYLPDDNTTLDPGVEVQELESEVTIDQQGEIVPQISDRRSKSRKVTTAAWESSLALSPDFRASFLSQLAEITPQTVFTGDIDVVFVPLNIRPPQSLESGRWKVIVVSQLMVFRGKNLEQVIPFKKEIYLQAVEPPEYKALPAVKPDKENPEAPIAQAIAKVRASGLEIYAIRDYTQEDL